MFRDDLQPVPIDPNWRVLESGSASELEDLEHPIHPIWEQASTNEWLDRTGSITWEIPNFSSVSNANLQFPRVSCELKDWSF